MTSPSISQLKLTLRSELRTQRGDLSDDQLKLAALGLVEQYKKHLSKKSYKKIAIYLQHDNEIDTSELIKLLVVLGCELYLPKIARVSSNHSMEFCRYDTAATLEKNRFGIKEPIIDDFIDINELDLIFLPLTAFDGQGNRLGMGGGYYDRALAKLTNTNTLLAGLAYDFQRIPLCPKESFDQSLKIVLTATSLIDFNR
ncbi:MAG: 5-formyltetrahydrofolate cyclo-ligase [Gammaproteobacteria bacterium]|nr:MAG: 5-formyltetrahydrofolate cyclo-ligase [Gammaproteobacteria bacterium]